MVAFLRYTDYSDRPDRMQSKQVRLAQLSLTNPRDALHHDQQQLKFYSDVAITTPLLWVICYPVARIDRPTAYLCTKFDDFRFRRSSDIIGAIFNRSHDLTTPL